MAIRSDLFGSVHLTEKDAEKFVRQVTYGRPNDAAKQALARGDELLNRYRERASVAKTKEPA
jgi:hypothetical protein